MKRAASVLVVVLALVLTACSRVEEPAATTLMGAEIDAAHVYDASEVPLRTTEGEARALSEVDKDLTLVFFGYTHCPDICGIVMSTVASALNRLDPDLRERVEMLFVTTDPARDDEEALRAYLDRIDPSFEGLTGDIDDVLEVGRSLKVAVEKGEKLPSGGYDVAHSDHVTGLDAEGDGFIVWTREVSSANLARDIELLLTR